MSLAVTFSTIPEIFLNLTDRFAYDKRPMLTRKIEGGYRPLLYSEVREQTALLYHALMKLGIKAGDRIALLSENRPEWVIADQAILLHGAIDVPIFPSQTAKQIEYILQDAGVTSIFVSNRFQLSKILRIRSEVKSLRHIVVMNDLDELPQNVISWSSLIDSGVSDHAQHPNALREALQLVRPDELATIIYTSGTTGKPKGVMLTHNNFVSNIKATAQVIEIGVDDLVLSFLPLCHVFERMGGYYTAMACGATIAYAESIETVAENMLEVSPTIIVAVPRLFERIYNRISRMIEKDNTAKRKIFYKAIETGREYVQATKRGKPGAILRAKHALAEKLVFNKLQQRTGGKIKYFVSGGAALPRELGEFFEAVGLLIIEGYGLTESSPVISVNPTGAHRFGSVGKPLPGIEVRIAEDGEILTRGPHIMRGYYNNKKATEEAIDKDGWLYTGDIGVLDENGYLYITDRKKHLFVSSGGKNIAPQPIESLFTASEYIDQFVLIGDKRMYLTALIVPDMEALKHYALTHDIAYHDQNELLKHPDIYRLMEKTIQLRQIDLANFEKVRRFALLENPFTIENGEMTPSMKIRREAVEQRYQALIESLYRS